MAASSPDKPERADVTATDHEREQALFLAANTTPLQRLVWLEEMLELLRDYLPRKDVLTEAERREWGVGDRP